MASKAQRLVTGSALRIFEFMTTALLGIILMPFIIRSLGDKMYGLWIFAGSFLGYYGLMDFGLNSAIQRYISRATGVSDYEEINKVINTALVIFTIIGFAALIISFIVAFITPILIKNITDVAVFQKVIFILGMSFAIGFPLRVFSGILTSNIRYDLRTAIELVKLTVRTILIIVFLRKGYGIVTLAMITFIMDILGYLANYYLVRKLYKYIVYSWSLVDKAKMRALFSYSVFTFISQIANQLKYNIDNLVIVIFIGLNPITLYSIGARLIKYFMDFMTSAVGLTFPIFSQYEGKNDYGSILEKYIFITKISGYLSLLIGGTFIIFGKPFIIRWVGENYIAGYYILLILGIPATLIMMQGPSGGLLYGLSKHKYFAIADSIEGVSNLVLSIILIKHYGIYGVALGTAIPMIITKVFIQPIYICNVLNIKYKKYYIDLLAPILINSIAILGIYWLIIKQTIHPNYFNIVFLVGIEMILFTVIVYSIGFNKEEKKYFTAVNGNKINNFSYLNPFSNKIGYIGWLGHENLGDEVIYGAFKLLFNKHKVLPFEYSNKLESFEKIRGRGVFNAVCLGGGTLIHPYGGETIKAFRIALVKYKMSFIFGTGVEDPSFRDRSYNKSNSFKEWVECLNKAYYIGVRGPLSKKILNENGFNNVEVVGDLAISNSSERIKAKKKAKILGLNFGVTDNKIWGDGESVLNFIVKFAKIMINKGWQLKIISANKRDESHVKEAIKRIGKQISVYSEYSSMEGAMGFFEDCDIFVGERLHSVILAMCAYTPSIMLEYNPKCLDFMASMELEEFSMRTDSLSLDKVIYCIDKIQDNIEFYQGKIFDKMCYYKRLQTHKANQISEIIKKC